MRGLLSPVPIFFMAIGALGGVFLGWAALLLISVACVAAMLLEGRREGVLGMIGYFAPFFCFSGLPVMLITAVIVRVVPHFSLAVFGNPWLR